MSVSKIGNDCCSCRVCQTVCRYQAIERYVDDYGFEQIKVDENKCVECGLCEKVCPILSKPTFNTEHFDNYAAYSRDETIKKQGSSGGLYGLFATNIIKRGGVVYGAAFNDALQLQMTRVTDIKSLQPLLKSKYLLSDTNTQFTRIKTDLDSGLQVLVCSTPCQISAIRLFLRKNYDNLILIEFVCHGVGSQTLFDDSVKYVEEKRGISIKSFTFREKFKSATSHYFSYCYTKNGVECTEKGLYLYFPYYNAYCKQLNCRDICYRCHYAQEDRVADITIGDFHTIAKYDCSIDRFAGVSMITCNNEHGRNFVKQFEKDLVQKPFGWEVLKMNNRFEGGNAKPNLSAAFMEDYRIHGFKFVERKYLNPTRDWKRIIYYKLPSFIRNIITKYL